MAEPLDPAQVLASILAEHGPLPEDVAIQRLHSAGLTDPDVDFEHLIDETGCAAAQLVDDRWVWLPTLLAGRLFTHRLSADEVAHDMLTTTPDLDPITTLCDDADYARFADGSPAYVAIPMYDLELLDRREIPLELVDPLGALLLAPGTLAAVGAVEGDVVGVRLTPDGLAIESVTAHADSSLGPRLAATLNPDEPVYFDAAVWTACAEDPTLFTHPLRPLSEIVDDHGLRRREEWFAPAEFDFDRWQFERGVARLTRRYGIEPDEALAVFTLVQFHESMALLLEMAEDDEHPDEASPGPLDEEPDVDRSPTLADLAGDVGAVLADPALAEILLTETIDIGRDGAAALGLLAESLEPRVAREARVAFRWLRAVALERIGDIDEAERELHVAESMNTAWPPVLTDLAHYASDRSDVERALSLLRRADAPPDDPMVALLERHRAQPRPGLGRNEACWCGSGRKYKKCHLGREELSLAECADWLYSKAAQYVVESGWRHLLLDLALERTRYIDHDDALAAGMAEPLVIDAVLFEGGAFEEFLAVRGSLLPEDERALAEQWLLVGRSVFEVEQVQRNRGVTVRDIRTGDTHDVDDVTASRTFTPGQLLCARITPVGDTMRLFGGVEPVPLRERDALIECLDDEPDAITLVAQLSRRLAPPVMTNTEGDPLVLREARLRVSDRDGIKAALDDVYDRIVGDQAAHWLEHVVTQGMSRISATLTLDGDTLRVETNSDRRMDRVQASLIRLDPTITVLDETRRAIRNLKDAEALAAQLPGGSTTVDPNDPEVAKVLDEAIRQYEARWLDEPIPALSGQTPREAADDPTRREDLIKLLASFPAGEDARGGMDADRLRIALGLGLPDTSG